MYNIFKTPVTEEQAPGYFSVITTPMDFQKISAKYEAGEYTSWAMLEEDLYTMYTNCVKYNDSSSIYHQQVGGSGGC